MSSGDFVYLYGFSPASGGELWRSDGTTEGTLLVKDIVPGTGSSNLYSSAMAGSTFFVSAYGGSTGTELWKSDGTAGGTSLVKDIHPYGYSRPALLTAWGERVAFTADDGVHGGELWMSDGTEAGTRQVADLSPGAPATVFDRIATVGNRVFFTATPAGGSRNFYVTDGTSEGTGVFEAGRIQSVYYPHVVDGVLYFNGIDSATSSRVNWRSDGTPAGTTPLSSTPVTSTSYAVPAGDRFFFLTTPAEGASELWRTDGSGGPAVFLKAVGTGGSMVASPAGDAVYFVGSTQATGQEVWKSDGTVAGTGVLREVDPGTGSSYPSQLLFAGGRLFFRADVGDGQRELWTSDGTAAGTVRVRRFADGIHSLAAFGDRVLFQGDDGVTGQEFWSSDGTEAGTRVVKDFRATGDGSPAILGAAGEKVFFKALLSGTGRVVLATDGSPGGTTHSNLLGYSETATGSTAVLGDDLVFNSENRNSDYEPWISDGTLAGPTRIKDIHPAGSSAPQFFTRSGSRLLFSADDGTHGRELWGTDGTGGGTSMVKDIVPGGAGATPRSFTRAGNQVFFTVAAGAQTELWASDGTSEETRRAATFDTAVDVMTPAGELLFFIIAKPYSNRELWRSDGSEAGTVRLLTLPAEFQYDHSGVTTWLGAGDLLFFTTRPSIHGAELWRSDGSEEGTYRLVTINGRTSSQAPGLRAAGDRVWFWIEDGSLDLWTSDGSAEGTRKLAAVAGPSPANVAKFTTAGDTALFLAGVPGGSYRLWKSDGTSARTGPVVLDGETFWSSTTEFFGTPRKLYLGLESEQHGKELFVLPVDELLSAGERYHDWAAASGLSGAAADPEASPHGDGVANLLKYAFHMDGSAPDVSRLSSGAGDRGLPAFSRITAADRANVLRMEFIRRKDSGLTYRPMFSLSLEDGAFQPMTGPEVVADIDSGRERVVVEHRVDPADDARCFGVVEVAGF